MCEFTVGLIKGFRTSPYYRAYELIIESTNAHEYADDKLQEQVNTYWPDADVCNRDEYGFEIGKSNAQYEALELLHDFMMNHHNLENS